MARQLVKQQKYSEIRQLLKCIKESGAEDKTDGDNVLLNCLDESDSIPAEVILFFSWKEEAQPYFVYILQISIVCLECR